MRHQNYVDRRQQSVSYELILRGLLNIAAEQDPVLARFNQHDAGAIVAVEIRAWRRVQNTKFNAIARPALAGAARY